MAVEWRDDPAADEEREEAQNLLSRRIRRRGDSTPSTRASTDVDGRGEYHMA